MFWAHLSDFFFFCIYLSWGVTSLGGFFRYCLNRSSKAWPMVLMTSWAKPSEHSRIWHAEGEEAQMSNKKARATCTWMQWDKCISMQAKYNPDSQKDGTLCKSSKQKAIFAYHFWSVFNWIQHKDFWMVKLINFIDFCKYTCFCNQGCRKRIFSYSTFIQDASSVLTNWRGVAGF